MREASLVLIADVRWKAGRMFTTSSSADRINATSSGRTGAPDAISIVASLLGASPFQYVALFGKGLFDSRRRNFQSQIPVAETLPARLHFFQKLRIPDRP